eukprot:SAG31_NODE_14123_length_826_cov_1.112792_1_plen_210_part_10
MCVRLVHAAARRMAVAAAAPRYGHWFALMDGTENGSRLMQEDWLASDCARIVPHLQRMQQARSKHGPPFVEPVLESCTGQPDGMHRAKVRTVYSQIVAGTKPDSAGQRIAHRAHVEFLDELLLDSGGGIAAVLLGNRNDMIGDAGSDGHVIAIRRPYRQVSLTSRVSLASTAAAPPAGPCFVYQPMLHGELEGSPYQGDFSVAICRAHDA